MQESDSSAFKLSRAFYARPTLEVAPELLGKYLVWESPQGKLVGMINEVEAYLGLEDPASHAFRGPTPRTEIMFEEAGHVYVYQIYGLHFCMNVVTEQNGVAGAVLIRSLIPISGIPIMEQRRGISGTGKNLTNGPAKLCKAFGITLAQNGIDLVKSQVMYIEDRGEPAPKPIATPRIGITKAVEKLWRFTI